MGKVAFFKWLLLLAVLQNVAGERIWSYTELSGRGQYILDMIPSTTPVNITLDIGVLFNGTGEGINIRSSMREKAILVIPNPERCGQRVEAWRQKPGTVAERIKHLQKELKWTMKEATLLPDVLQFTEALFPPWRSCAPVWAGLHEFRSLNGMTQKTEKADYWPYRNTGGKVGKNETHWETLAGSGDNWGLAILVDYFAISFPNRVSIKGTNRRAGIRQNVLLYVRAYMPLNKHRKPEMWMFTRPVKFNNASAIMDRLFEILVEAVKEMTESQRDILGNNLKNTIPIGQLVDAIKKLDLKEDDPLSVGLYAGAYIQRSVDEIKILVNGSGWATSTGMIILYVVLSLAVISGLGFLLSKWIKKLRDSTG